MYRHNPGSVAFTNAASNNNNNFLLRAQCGPQYSQHLQHSGHAQYAQCGPQQHWHPQQFQITQQNLYPQQFQGRAQIPQRPLFAVQPQYSGQPQLPGQPPHPGQPQNSLQIQRFAGPPPHFQHPHGGDFAARHGLPVERLPAQPQARRQTVQQHSYSAGGHHAAASSQSVEQNLVSCQPFQHAGATAQVSHQGPFPAPVLHQSAASPQSRPQALPSTQPQLFSSASHQPQQHPVSAPVPFTQGVLQGISLSCSPSSSTRGSVPVCSGSGDAAMVQALLANQSADLNMPESSSEHPQSMNPAALKHISEPGCNQAGFLPRTSAVLNHGISGRMTMAGGQGSRNGRIIPSVPGSVPSPGHNGAAESALGPDFQKRFLHNNHNPNIHSLLQHQQQQQQQQQQQHSSVYHQQPQQQSSLPLEQTSPRYDKQHQELPPSPNHHPHQATPTTTTTHITQPHKAHPGFRAKSRSAEFNGSRPKEGERRGEKGGVGRGHSAASKGRQYSSGDGTECTKEKLTEEMRQSTKERFPNLRQGTYFVPPIRNNKTKYQRLKELSTKRQEIMEQRTLQAATLLGDQTEDTISRCLSVLASQTEEPMVILTNYQYDDYLFLTEHRTGPPASNSTSRTKDSAKNSSGDSQDANHPDPMTGKKHCEISESSANDEMMPVPVGSQSDGTEVLREDLSGPQDGGEDLETEPKSNPSSPSPPHPSPVDSPLDSSAKKGFFPTPRDLESALKRGDFDNLIISRRLGFIVIEAKTLLGLETNTPPTEQHHLHESPTSSEGREMPELEEDAALNPVSDIDVVQLRKSRDKASPQNGPREGVLTAEERVTQSSVGDHSPDKGGECQCGDLVAHTEISTGTGTNHCKPNHEHLSKLDVPSKPQDQPDDIKCTAKPEAKNICSSSEHPEKTTTASAPVPSPTNHHKDHPDPANQREDDIHLRSSTSSDQESHVTSGKRESMEEDFRKTISKSLNQLRKAKTVLRHLTSDLPGCPAITKVLALPNTSRAELKQLLEDPALGKDCCEVLETQTMEEALDRCLTAEHVNTNEDITATNLSPRDVTGKAVTPLMQWWWTLEKGILSRRQEKNVERWSDESDEKEGEDGGGMEMSCDFYEQIVSRFCGPFSRLKSRTVADCIHLTGVDFGRSILRAEQLRLLDSSSPFLCLTGPPGSGKTLILAIKAGLWAKQGDQVVVVRAAGVDWGSLISWTLYNRVRDTLQDHQQEEARRLAYTSSPPPPAANDKRKSQTPRHKKPKGRPLSTSQTACAAENSHKKSAERGRTQEEGEDTKNVHQVFIRRETNVDAFVDDLLQKYQGCNLRIIVDERPRYVTVESTFNHLWEAQRDLEEMKRLYIRVREQVGSILGCGEETSVSGFQKCQNCTFFEDSKISLSESDTPMASKVEGERTVTTGLQKKAKENKMNKNCPCIHNTTQSFSPSVTNPPIIGSVTTSENHSTNTSSHKTKNPHQEKPHPGKPTAFPNPSTKQIHEKEPPSPNSNQHHSECSPLLPKESGKERDSVEIGQGRGDHFTAMDDRMEKLEKRFQLMQPNKCGGLDIVWSKEWLEKLEVLQRLFCEVRALKTQVAPTLLASADSVYGLFVASLEELSRLMVSTMGHMYLAYVALTFFQVEQLFAKLRAVASHRASDSGQSSEISVWSSSVYTHYIPKGYERGDLNHSIRCPPTVQRILRWTEGDMKNSPGYSYIMRGCDVSPPLPSDGPPVTWIDHSSHQHSDSEVNDCAQCGQALAKHLLHTLALKHWEQSKGRRGKNQTQQSQLYFHDVIICGSPIHKPECAFIQAMVQEGIVFELENDNLASPPPYKDKILIIGGATVQGVESKIVVFVPELKRITDAEKAASSVPSAASSEPDASYSPSEGASENSTGGQQSSPAPHNSHVVQDSGVQSSSVLESVKGEKYSPRDLQEMERLRRLGQWNRDYLWHVASRSLSHLIVFHI